jgi:hypothetical protein
MSKNKQWGCFLYIYGLQVTKDGTQECLDVDPLDQRQERIEQGHENEAGDAGFVTPPVN